jgi:hypothetical protein
LLTQNIDLAHYLLNMSRLVGWEEKLREVFTTIQAKSQYHRDRFNHLNPTQLFFLAATS